VCAVCWYHVYLPSSLPQYTHLLGAGGQDIRVTYDMSMFEKYTQLDFRLTSVEDGHGGATEELTASGTQFNLHRQYVSGSPPKS
jgi:hypothetical protein